MASQRDKFDRPSDPRHGNRVLETVYRLCSACRKANFATGSNRVADRQLLPNCINFLMLYKTVPLFNLNRGEMCSEARRSMADSGGRKRGILVGGCGLGDHYPANGYWPACWHCGSRKCRPTFVAPRMRRLSDHVSRLAITQLALSELQRPPLP